MKIEFHLIQNFAPSCLNRDDTNTPKSCLFGGTRRARVSSQCLKRSIRLHMRDYYGIPTGCRTRRLAGIIADQLGKRGRDRAEAVAKARIALALSGFKADEKDPDYRTQVGLYLSQAEIDALADAVEKDWDLLVLTPPEEAAEGGARGKRPKKSKEGPKLAHVPGAISAIKGSVAAADIALFGRMVAENTHMKVDAACQVAHALSTHPVEPEMDYFTAVDDAQPDDVPGAGMMGLVGFQSACFYRYALIDRAQLVDNLKGDATLAKETILAFLRASVEAIPSARQNGSAAHNWPDYVGIRVGARLPQSLANAFEERLNPNGSLVGTSVQRLEKYRKDLVELYGSDGEYRRMSTISEFSDGPLPELESWLREKLEAA